MFVVRYKSIFPRPPSIPLLRRSITITSTRTAQNATQEGGNARAKGSQREKKAQNYLPPLTEDEIQKITNTDHIMYVTKVRQKKPERKPLLKSFFVGEVDAQLLAYPQVMTVKEVAAFQTLVDKNERYFGEDIGKCAERSECDVPNAMLAEYRRLKLFGANVEQRFGGMGNFSSEMSWLSETEALDLRSFFVLGAHRLAVEAITDHGSDNHHIEYLARMARGSYEPQRRFGDLKKKVWRLADFKYPRRSLDNFSIYSLSRKKYCT